MAPSYSPLVPRVSLRVPSFFGPCLLAGALLIASSFTSPTFQGFTVVDIKDPTYKGSIGIWGVCQGYKESNATTANPNATLTGNATADAITAKMGVNSRCSSSMVGWTYSLPVNSTGLASIALPNTDLGVNVAANSDAGNGYTYHQVMTSGQSSILIIHLIAGLLILIGLAILIIPHKHFTEKSPNLARFLKTGSVSLLLVFIGWVLALVSFVVELVTAKSIANTINAIGGGGGTTANIGNLQWYSLSCAIVLIPGMASTRGQM